ncbi:hypothetical protein L1887_54067 [Cichorium endivia]|nr:hypothetical protein L1887_54067 [Cichorium endivia]
MKARCPPSAKAAAASWTHTFAHPPTPSRMVTAGTSRLHAFSTITTRPSTASMSGRVSMQMDSSQLATRPEEALVTSLERPRQRPPWVRLNLEDTVRIFAPGASTFPFTEANTLEDTLVGLAAYSPGKYAALASDHERMRLILKAFLRRSSLSEADWVAIRNAMLCKSWPDARRYMVNTDDSAWPLYVLRRAVSKVATPSEASDALALLALTVQRVASFSTDLRWESYSYLTTSFATISSFCFSGDGRAWHLVPRLGDVLSTMISAFPNEMPKHRSFVFDFTRRCTRLADERARNAMICVLESLQGDGQPTKKIADVRNEVIQIVVGRIEIALTKSAGKTAASEQFANTELMDLLTEQHVPQHSPLEMRALLSAVAVAGRNRDYRRIRHYFDRLEQCKQELDIRMAATDYLELAKALVRTAQGSHDAMEALQQAERLLAAEYEDADMEALPEPAKRRLNHVCLDMLQVMAKTPEVHLQEALSLLGIFVRGSGADMEGERGETHPLMSQAFKQLRGDVYAYTMMMQGCLLRGRPDVACAVWQAMLDRNVLPNTACLSVLLQNLFRHQEVAEALRQLALWTDVGISQHAARPQTMQDIELESLGAPAFVLPFSQPHASLSEADEVTDRYKVEADPILASVVFSGLHSCGAAGTESLWDAYRQTVRLFPDAPVLALFLKAACGTEATSSQGASFGRQVFRSMLFGKHPELVNFRAPLQQQLEAQGAAGWILSHDAVGAKMEQWFSSAFGVKQSSTAVSPDDLGALVFTSKLFEHYLRLLLAMQHLPGHVSDARLVRQELIDVLAWMRQLQLKPSETHVALSVLEIEERLPPPIAARHMEVLDAWLADWLGEAKLPSEELMRRVWRWKMERNGQARGWFDRIPGPWDEAPLEE